MPRVRPPGRLDDLVEAAARVFTQKGFRRAQMADVARELRVSPGTLYGYVEGKEALFDLAVQRAFVDDPPEHPALPVKTPPPEELVAHVRERVNQAIRLPRLAAATRRDEPEDGDARAELEEILRELYSFVAKTRRGMALIERAAADRPELAALYFQGGRARLLRGLERYLAARIERGLLLPVPDVEISARFLLETISWFAKHRYGDLGGEEYDDELTRETVVALLMRALAEEKK